MRVSALHTDVIVFVSEVWQTTCTAVRGGEEGFLIDSPLYPEELGALPGVLEQAGFPVSGLLATHGDWDHVLGRLAFPGAALGAAESTAARLQAEPGAAQRQLREFDQEHYVARPTPLSLGTVQALPVPGKLELGAERELELLATPGHTTDGVAYWMPWLAVLCCGDYLSPVEIPMLNPGGDLQAYRQTLLRLGEVIPRAQWVVPGHGGPIDGPRAQEILSEDRAYIEAMLADPATAEPPRSRVNPVQRRIHEENLKLVG